MCIERSLPCRINVMYNLGCFLCFVYSRKQVPHSVWLILSVLTTYEKTAQNHFYLLKYPKGPGWHNTREERLWLSLRTFSSSVAPTLTPRGFAGAISFKKIKVFLWITKIKPSFCDRLLNIWYQAMWGGLKEAHFLSLKNVERWMGHWLSSPIWHLLH